MCYYGIPTDHEKIGREKAIEEFRCMILNIKSFEDNPKSSKLFQGWNLCWNVFRIQFNMLFPKHKINISEFS